jgi:hypothetical protein
MPRARWSGRVPGHADVSTGTRRGCVASSRSMRALAIILILAAGCGGKRQLGAAGPPAAAAAFPAARWIPGTPTYVVAAKTMRDAQRAFRDVLDTFGMVAGVEPGEISEGLIRLLAVDPLSAEAVAAIGVDLDGGVALFSEDVNPTFVVRLASPVAMQAFFDHQRQRGMVTQSVVVDGAEVFSTRLSGDVLLSWVVDGEWLWVHFGGPGEGTAWFSASKRPSTATWGARWQAAQQLAQKSAALVGFANLRDLAVKIAQRTGEGLACARQFEAVRGVGVAIEGEGSFVGGTLAVDLASAQTIAGSVVAPPPGWATASAKAPLAAQWNLDLRVAAAWVQPCIARVEEDGSGRRTPASPDLVATLDQFGVRTGRAFVHSLDPEDKSGTGAVAIDLSHGRYFAQLLDQIPMRRRFEKSRAFGAYKGKHLSVPFVATVDYVLDDRVFLAAMGDGLLERAASGVSGAAPEVVAIDLMPAGLPVDVWAWLFAQAELPSPKRLAQRLQTWREIHLGARLDRDRLVIEARGNRR